MDSIWGLRGMTVAINNAGNVSVLVSFYLGVG